VDSDEDRGSTPLASTSQVRGSKTAQTGNETGNKSGDVQGNPRRFAEDLMQWHALVQKLYFAASEAPSFWKRGSFRSGSNIGSSRSSAGVSGKLLASGLA